MDRDSIEKLKSRVEKKVGGMTPNQRKQHVLARRAKLSATIESINGLLAELGCLGAETKLSIESPIEIKRVRIYGDPKVKALPQKLPIPKFPQLRDITHFPKK
jgi:hypothetical protein